MDNRHELHREAIVSILGAPPDPAPLEPKTLEIVREIGYRREKVAYNVEPGERVHAYLLIPTDTKSPRPAVYCCHSRNPPGIGKREMVGLGGSSDAALAVELVKLGYVTFAPDAVAGGERQIKGALDEFDGRFFEMTRRLIRGETLLHKILWDISRGLDYLESRPEVDPEHIGIIGYSDAGSIIVWAAAMEKRIRAAVAHCGVSSYRERIRRRIDIPPELAVPRVLQVTETDLILGLVAPRPFLISATTDDPRNPDAEAVYTKAQAIYERLGVPGRLAFYMHRGGHEFTLQMRRAAYRWLDSWLMPY